MLGFKPPRWTEVQEQAAGGAGSLKGWEGGPVPGLSLWPVAAGNPSGSWLSTLSASLRLRVHTPSPVCMSVSVSVSLPVSPFIRTQFC
jgi:hypothetical protein